MVSFVICTPHVTVHVPYVLTRTCIKVLFLFIVHIYRYLYTSDYFLIEIKNKNQSNVIDLFLCPCLIIEGGMEFVLHLSVGRSVDKHCPLRQYLLTPLLGSCQTWHSGCPLESRYSLLIFRSYGQRSRSNFWSSSQCCLF